MTPRGPAFVIVLIVGATVLAAAVNCTPVEGDRIRGAQLALADTRFAAMDPEADLGPSPAAGQQRVFHAFELDRIAAQYSIAPSGAPTGDCFERATVRLEVEQVTKVLRTALNSHPRTEGAQLELVDFSRNPLPRGSAEFRVEDLAQDGLWRGRLVYGNHRSVPIWARVRVIDAQGRPIASWRTNAAPDIVRGDTVRVEVSIGAVALHFEAPAESSGHIGDQVVMRNPVTGERFRAVVEAHGKVGIRK